MIFLMEKLLNNHQLFNHQSSAQYIHTFQPQHPSSKIQTIYNPLYIIHTLCHLTTLPHYHTIQKLTMYIVQTKYYIMLNVSKSISFFTCIILNRSICYNYRHIYLFNQIKFTKSPLTFTPCYPI